MMGRQVCGNGHCEEWRWLIDPDTELCALCLYREREQVLLERTWVDEESPEFKAACDACDAFEAAGPQAVNQEIWDKMGQRLKAS